MSARKLPRGAGTIKLQRGRYVPYLPRHLSRAPAGCRNPNDYQERLAPCSTWDEAARLLAAATAERKADPFSATKSLAFSHDAALTIERLRADALRDYGSESRANRRVSTPRSICRHWLSKEHWWALPSSAIETLDLQATIDRMLREGRTSRGEPVSVSFAKQTAGFLRRVFADLSRAPNPADGLRLPRKRAPEVPHWGLRQQEAFFRCPDIDLRDRVMAGCGMGAGLRVGELLSLETDDLHLDAPDPYLTVLYGGPDHAPPKGRRARRVQLFEPGLGFLQIWMAEFYAEHPSGLAFAGPRGGYAKAWPEQFPGWGRILRLRGATSHLMRHSYAVSMLSGTWGYEPQGLDFVSEQLGHADRATTDRYYGAFESDTWRQQVRRMTGREERPTAAHVVTAEALLRRSTRNELVNSTKECNSRHSPQDNLSTEDRNASIAVLGRARPNTAADLAERILRLLASGDPHAVRRVVELCEDASADQPASGAAWNGRLA